MRRWFGGLRTLRDKISWLVTAISAVAIIGVSFSLAAINHRNLTNSTLSALQAQTDMLALYSGAPLVFGDRATAREVLNAFQAMPSVSAATLYALDGTVFASYRRSAAVAREAGPAPPGRNARGDRMVTDTVVQEQGQRLGRLEVVYDLAALNRQLWESFALAVLVSVGAIALALVVAGRLATVVTRPIAVLGDTAQRVARTRDYSVRAPNHAGDDEVGAFTTAFNDMLQEIERQDRDLKASRAQAEAASRLKDEFLATVSHELRTPMTPILGWAQMLPRIAAGNPQVLQAAGVIERNALAQTRIVDDLLEMSRIISGKVRLDLQPVRINEVLAAALDAVRAAAQARQIVLQVDVPAGLPLLSADPHRLQQVLWNLLSNAIKFTESGGRVEVRVLRPEPERLEVQVRDTGQGIEPDFLPYVFERFRQADASVTRSHGGLGLGLAIVKQLVELHGGTVAVASAGAGQGTTFTVSLPFRVADAPSAPSKPAIAPDTHVPGRAATAAAPTLDGLRILLVEDEADARQWIRHVLVEQGARVEDVGSARDALAALQANAPDVLVSDIGMPGTDGYALIRTVRELPPRMGGAIPAIALTAFARKEDRARALDAGYQLHLGKPIDRDALVTAIRSLAGPLDGGTAPRPPEPDETLVGAT